MRYPPDLVDALAAEYVIGTLDGAARRRFEALLRLRADARYAVRSWEALLYSLTANIEPVSPPRSVWRGIRRRIDGPQQKQTLRFRPGLAALAASLAIFAFWLGTVLPPDSTQAAPERVAVFADAESRPLWTISLDADTGVLISDSAGIPAAEGDLIYELWALPADGAPQSLGVLSTAAGRYEETLPPEIVVVVEQSASLAISLEPPGGSPTGLPTGPIVHVTPLARL